MKITRVEPVLLSSKPSREIRWSGGVISTVHAALVQVHTDEGITGLGETYVGIFAPLAVRGIVEALEPLLIGEDPRNIAALTHRLVSKTLFWARSAPGSAPSAPSRRRSGTSRARRWASRCTNCSGVPFIPGCRSTPAGGWRSRWRS